MSDWLTASWKMVIVRGVIAVIFGLVALVWPIATVVTLVWVWGIWALTDGLTSIVQAFRVEGFWPRVGWGVLGIVALVAAVLAIFRPVGAAVVLTWVLGIWLLVRAVVEIVLAFGKSPALPRWLMFVTAGVDIVLGLLFITNPGRSALTITVVLGFFAIFWGIIAIGVALSARHAVKQLAAA